METTHKGRDGKSQNDYADESDLVVGEDVEEGGREEKEEKGMEKSIAGTAMDYIVSGNV